MKVNIAFILCPHGFKMVLFESKEKRLRHLDEAILAYEYLGSSQTLMSDPVCA